MSLMVARRAMLLGQGTNTGGSSGGSSGGSGGGSSGSGGATSPTGVSGTWTKFYETLFPGTTLPAGWTPGRYTYSTVTSNESTNIPGSQLDTSYGGNVSVNNGLTMNYSAQPDSSQAATFPYAGSHVSAYQQWITSNSFTEIVMKVNNLGAQWCGIATYIVNGSTNGEMDWAEFGDTWDTKYPTFNVHNASYSAQNQSNYTGNPSLAGDGKYHIYGLLRSGNNVTPYLDGVPAGSTRALLAIGDYGIFFELGVYKFSTLGNAGLKSFGAGMQISRVTVWH